MNALIRTQNKETARGDVQKAYQIFEDRGVDMPDPLKLISASPGYFSIMLSRNNYYSSHPNLGMSLLAHIRYFVSSRLEYGFCKRFNREMLARMGMTEDDFAAMGDDPGKSLLEDHDRLMLTFVLDAMDDPEAVSAEDIDRLRQAGWTDGDMLDALAQGVGMIDHNIFMRVFKAA